MVILGVVLIAASVLWFMNAAGKPVVAAQNPTSGSVSSNIPYPEVKRVSVADAKAASELKTALFIDVRGAPYFSEGHIPEAIAMTQDEMQSRMGELNKDQWLILYCT
jgi:3-mercaptopyruvate sulfurtransferase SseA